jgi:hypothetical protein
LSRDRGGSVRRRKPAIDFSRAFLPRRLRKPYSQAVEELSARNVRNQPPLVRCPDDEKGYLKVAMIGHIGSSRFVMHPAWPGGDVEYYAADGRLTGKAYNADIARYSCCGQQAYSTIFGVVPAGKPVVDEPICMPFGKKRDPP